MGIFKKRKTGGFADVIRCDEPDYLIWKWHPAGVGLGEGKRETALRTNSVVRVKDGEVAVFVYKQKDDKYFIFASSAKHLDAWKRSLSKNHNISCFFIFKSDEIEFANFPSCRSRCRGKYISETETIRLLKKYNVPLHQNWDNSEQPLVSAV